MFHARRHIRGRLSGGAVAIAMALAEALAQVLAAGHQIGAVQPEAGPIFEHAQAFTGTIEVRVEQPLNASLLGCRRA
jgi:hypothetical protein